MAESRAGANANANAATANQTKVIAAGVGATALAALGWYLYSRNAENQSAAAVSDSNSNGSSTGSGGGGGADSKAVAVVDPKAEKERLKALKQKQAEEDAKLQTVVGFKNLGNTCFLNCLLQALSSLPAFGRYVRDLNAIAPSDFAKTLDDCCNAQVSNPSRFHRILTQEAQLFSGYHQNDAHELFHYMLDILSKRPGSVGNKKFVAGIASLIARQSHSVFDLVSLANSTKPKPTPAAPTANGSGSGSGSGGSGSGSGGDTKTAAAPAPAVQYQPMPMPPRDPFTGLMANFLLCTTCNPSNHASSAVAIANSNSNRGYSVRHDPFVSQSLTVVSTDLRMLLKALTYREKVNDVRCMSCSIDATLTAVEAAIEKLDSSHHSHSSKSKHRHKSSAAAAAASASDATESSSKKSEKREALYAQRDRLLSLRSDANRQHSSTQRLTHPADIVKPTLVKTAFTKQVLFVRLPAILCLHINRLVGDHKIMQFVQFEPLLDMTPFCAPMSQYSKIDAKVNAPLFGSGRFGGTAVGATPSADRLRRRNFYRLIAVVVHHGGSSGGHFTTYRRLRTAAESKGYERRQAARKAKAAAAAAVAANAAAAAAVAANAAATAPTPPTASGDGSSGAGDATPKKQRRRKGESSAAVDGEDESGADGGGSTGYDPADPDDDAHFDPSIEIDRELRADWVHISDESITKCDIRSALAAQAYMLFYERLVDT